jgi:hypothetical protein
MPFGGSDEVPGLPTSVTTVFDRFPKRARHGSGQRRSLVGVDEQHEPVAGGEVGEALVFSVSSGMPWWT